MQERGAAVREARPIQRCEVSLGSLAHLLPRSLRDAGLRGPGGWVDIVVR